MKCDRHTTIISDVFTDDKRAINFTPWEFDAIKLFNHGFGFLSKSLEVFFGPPVIDVAVFIHVGTVIIKGVRDFMTDNRTNTT